MKDSLRTGFSFGLTSGLITTIGLIVGLGIGTGSKLSVIGGIFTIAIADAFSDSFGIHVSEEAENVHTQKEIWEATFSTFFTKLLFALTFILPVVSLSLSMAIIVSIIWGFSLLGIFSYHIATQRGKSSWKIVLEHLLIASLVVLTSYLIGTWVGRVFG